MKEQLLSNLTDNELIAEVTRLARCARDVTANLVAHLAEMEVRGLHVAAGFPSLFAYCTAVLRLSDGETYNRIEAARAARRFPRVLAMLADGSLSLTTAQMLARRLTDENHQTLLSAAAHRSKAELQEVLARHFPRPDVAASVRKLPSPPETPPPAVATAPAAPVVSPAVAGDAATPAALESESASAPVLRVPAAKYRPPVTPLAPDRYQFTFTASAETRELLELAKDMLRHAVPNGDTGEIMKRALAALVADFARKKFAVTMRPRQDGRGVKNPSDVTAAVKREVWIRDLGRCAFVSKTGRRCGARGFLEFHHVLARAHGGPGTVANIELRCRAHNAYEADLEFGQRRPRGEWDVPQPCALVPERVRASDQAGVPSLHDATGPVTVPLAHRARHPGEDRSQRTEP